MTLPLYSQAALTVDVPEHNLRRGDVATIVEHIALTDFKRGAYVIEVFNAVGESMDVLIVPESSIEPLRPDEVWSIRQVAVET